MFFRRGTPRQCRPKDGMADTDHALDPILWLVTLQHPYGPHNLIKFTIAEACGAKQAKTDMILTAMLEVGALPLAHAALTPGYLQSKEAKNPIDLDGLTPVYPCFSLTKSLLCAWSLAPRLAVTKIVKRG